MKETHIIVYAVSKLIVFGTGLMCFLVFLPTQPGFGGGVVDTVISTALAVGLGEALGAVEAIIRDRHRARRYQGKRINMVFVQGYQSREMENGKSEKDTNNYEPYR